MPYYKQESQSVFENCSYKLYYDWSTTTDQTVHSNRPDRVMLDNTIKEVYLYLFDVSVSNGHNLCSTFSEREAPYTDIKEELTRIWQMDLVYIVPLVSYIVPLASYCPQRISTLLPPLPPPKKLYETAWSGSVYRKQQHLAQAVQLERLQQNKE